MSDQEPTVSECETLAPGGSSVTPLERLKLSKDHFEKKLALINDVLAECEKNPEAVELALKIIQVAHQY